MHDFHYFFVSWLFIHPHEHNYTGQPAQFLLFLNLSNTMLTSAFNPIVLHLCTQWHCLEVSITNIH